MFLDTWLQSVLTSNACNDSEATAMGNNERYISPSSTGVKYSVYTGSGGKRVNDDTVVDLTSDTEDVHYDRTCDGVDNNNSSASKRVKYGGESSSYQPTSSYAANNSNKIFSAIIQQPMDANSEELQHQHRRNKYPMPTRVNDFKDHPVYVLQRHLLSEQAMHPSKVGTFLPPLCCL